MMSSPQPIDVVFFFSNSTTELRFSSALLTANSPFFRRLLEDATRPPTNQAAAMPAFGSSASDGREPFSIQLAPALAGQAHKNPALRPHTFTVANIDPDSFAALVLYTITGHIKFPPPASQDLDEDPAAARASKRRKPGPVPMGAYTPPPIADSSPVASWKAVCLAADTLGLPGVKSPALAAFKESLTLKNVVGELFGPTSAAHTEVREVAVKFARDNRDRVMGMREM